MVYVQLENVAIANALQLEAARCHASPFPLQLLCHAKFEVACDMMKLNQAYEADTSFTVS